jgi:hypothetical protein
MRYISLLLGLILSLNLGAQSFQRMRAGAMSGFIIPHAQDLKPFAGTHPYTLYLGWQTMPTAQNYWDACNCFHYLGVEFNYVNFNNKEVLGEAFILSGTFEPVLWSRGRFSLSLHTGIGAAWITKVYDPVSNPTNRFFSNNLSFLLFLAPILEYRLSDTWRAHAGYYYNHISNGGQKQPNRGMNFPQAAIGVSRFLQQAELPQYPKTRPEGRFHSWMEAGATTRKTGQGDERKIVLNLVGGTYRPLTAFNALGAGVEAGMDNSVVYYTEGGKYTLAPFVSHHFLLGKFDFSQRMAVYIARPGDSEEFSFYQRYVLLFTPGKSLSLGVSLKAHRHMAQNLDLRIAWKF